MFEQNLYANPATNPQGDWISLEFLPIEEVSTLIPLGGKCALTVNRDFRKIVSAIDINSETQRNEDGSYHHTVTASIALRTQAAHGTLNQMAQSGQYLVRLTDFGGSREIFGTPETPMRFSWSESSEGDTLTALTWEGDTLTPSLMQI